MEDQTSNCLKHENYKEQNIRLSRALKNRFYLEAIFIEYSMLEDRTESILRYTGNFPKGDDFVSINRKIHLIEKLIENKTALIRHYFGAELISSLKGWKEKRNAMIHALIKRNITTEDLENIALEGEFLAKKMCSLSTNYKRKLERAGKLVPQ